MIKLNPVYKKELKVSVRTGRLALLIFVYNLILAGIGMLVFYSIFESAMNYGGSINYSSIVPLYITLVIIEFIFIIFIVPSLTASSISGERERQTLDILLTTKLTPMQIVIGKLESSISTVILLAVSSLPILSIVFTMGGVKFFDLLQIMAFFVVTAICAGSLGILCSTVFKKTSVATAMSFGGLIAIGGGSVFVVFMTYLIQAMRSSNMQTYVQPDVGYLVTLLLINPAVSFASLLFKQVGGESIFSQTINEVGSINSFISDNWFIISVIVQLGLAVLCLRGAAKRLNPLNEKTKRRRKG